jgi:integrase/recombinase XerD
MTQALTVRPTASLGIALRGAAVHLCVRREEVARARELAIAEGNHVLRTLIDTLWFTGARISEVLALQVRDVDFGRTETGEGCFVLVPTLKTRKHGTEPPRRGVPVPPAYALPLSLYVRRERLNDDSPLVPWGRTKAWEEVKRITIAAGVDPDRAHPHAFRHGHGIHALRNGVPINVVKETMGHSSILTTQIYVRAAGTDIVQSYQAVKW